MKNQILFLILLLLSLTAIAQNNNIGGLVSSNWITRVIKGENKNELINEFGKQFPSKAISTNPAENNNENSYLNLTKINLDNDIDDEYLIFIGSDYANTMFYVVDNDYKIIYEEYLWLHNQYPQLKIYNSTDQHKLFSFKFLYGRGSGHWLFTNKIFRIEACKVSMVLEFVDDSNDTFNYKGINGRIKSENIDEYGGQIFFDYSIELYPHEVILEKLGISDESLILIKKEKEVVIYSYDNTKMKFVQNENGITSEMEKYFFEPGNDSLFLKAFSKDLDRILETGTVNEKKVVEFLRKNKN
jgi:hypothetical protein